MGFTPSLLDQLLYADPMDAWSAIFEHLWGTMSPPVGGDIPSEMVRRDKALESLDLVLSSSAWELWSAFEASTPSSADTLVDFWQTTAGPKAVLVLDALSLREAPWLIEGAQKRGYTLHRGTVTASALPSDTTSFARALGLQQRSALAAGTVPSCKLTGATTALFEQAWRECADTLPNSPHLFVWHDWPDTLMHGLSNAGPGLRQLATDAHKALTSDDFWLFIERLATGRRLVITADHGYAASGQYSDVMDQDQKEYLQKKFGAERFAASKDRSASHWLPPIDLPIETTRGPHRFVMGRRAWSVQGGRKNLSHGGASVLEVAVPFLELSRPL